MTYKKCKLGDIADIISGYAFKTNDFVQSGVGVIKIKNITPPVISNDDMQCVKEDFAENLEKYKVRYNDILISMTGSNVNQFASAVGKIGRLRDKNNYYMLNQRVGKIVIKESSLYNQDFLYYYLTQTSVRWELASSAGGSANQANISPKQIKEITIPFPKIELQNNIANILDSIDDKIELNNNINENLQSISRLLFKHWFVDFEFPNEEGLPYKSSGGEMVDSELGMIPNGWEVTELDNLCNITSSKRIFMDEYVQSGIPFYRSKEVIEKSKGAVITTELYISLDKYREIKEKFSVPQEGDILLTSVGTLGIPYKVEGEEFYFKDGNLTWFKDYVSEEYSNYIYLWLLSNEGKSKLDSIAIGSTQKALTIAALKKLKVVVPSDLVLKRFQAVVSKQINEIQLNNKGKECLMELRDTLLPKLMNGEIDLSNFEINQ